MFKMKLAILSGLSVVVASPILLSISCSDNADDKGNAVAKTDEEIALQKQQEAFEKAQALRIEVENKIRNFASQSIAPVLSTIGIEKSVEDLVGENFSATDFETINTNVEGIVANVISASIKEGTTDTITCTVRVKSSVQSITDLYVDYNVDVHIDNSTTDTSDAITARDESINIAKQELAKADNPQTRYCPEMDSTIILDQTHGWDVNPTNFVVRTINGVTYTVKAVNKNSEDFSSILVTVYARSAILEEEFQKDNVTVFEKTYDVEINGFKPATQSEVLSRQITENVAYAPIDFNDLPVDGTRWVHGIAEFSAANTISLLLDAATRMGWHREMTHPDKKVLLETTITENGITFPGFSDNQKASPTPLEARFGNPGRYTNHLYTDLDGNEYENLNWRFDGGLGVRKTLEPITKDNVGYADLSNGMSFEIPENFDSLETPEELLTQLLISAGCVEQSMARLGGVSVNVKWFFQGKNNVIFSIDEENHMAYLWPKNDSVISPENQIQGYNNSVNTFNDNLDKLYALQPAPVGSTAIENVRMKADIDPQVKAGYGPQFGVDLMSTYQTDAGTNLSQIDYVTALADSHHKGSTVVEVQYTKEFGSAENIIVSNQGWLPEYTVLTGEQIPEYLNLMYALLANIKTLYESSLSILKLGETFIDKDIIDAFRYIAENVNNPQVASKEKITEYFLQLNNGTYYWPAIEVFVRGIVNIPRNQMPKNTQGSSLNGIIHLSSITGMIPWFRNTDSGAPFVATDN